MSLDTKSSMLYVPEMTLTVSEKLIAKCPHNLYNNMETQSKMKSCTTKTHIRFYYIFSILLGL